MPDLAVSRRALLGGAAAAAFGLAYAGSLEAPEPDRNPATPVARPDTARSSPIPTPAAG